MTDSERGRRTLTTLGLVSLPILCCGLPLLIAAGAFGALGSVLGNPWLIGAATLALIAVIVRRVRGEPAHPPDPDNCCAPGEAPPVTD